MPERMEDGTGKLRVLVVDDHAEVRETLKVVLGGDPGIDVVGESADGHQAVEAADRLIPHVILMDGQMPRMDGPAATAAIRRAHPQILIIGFSSSGTLGEMMRATGAFDVVPKSGELDQLLEAVERARSELLSRTATDRLGQAPDTSSSVAM